MLVMRQVGDVTEDLGQISWPGGSYQIRRNDLIWAARAAAHEGDHEAVLWTWTSRWVSWGHRRYDTLADMIRAHSQPVNPIWLKGGRCCPEALEDCTSPCFVTSSNPTGVGGHCPCSTQALGRRARAIRLTWDQIARSLQTKVTDWATARLSNPVPKATDFAASPCLDFAAQQRREIKLLYVIRNCFYADKRSRFWPSQYVKIRMGDRVASDRGVNLFVLGLIAAGGYAGWKYLNS